MPDHTHPQYEDALNRIAAAQEQQQIQIGKIVTLIDRLAEGLLRLDEKLNETADKLNAVIDLMDRHLREHRE
jgi:ABC-type transporter Mla subunit MlaD